MFFRQNFARKSIFLRSKFKNFVLGQLKSEAKAYTSTHDNIFGPSTPAEKRQFGVEDDGQRAAGGFKQRHKEGEFYSAKPGESFGGVAAGDRNASNVVLALDAQPTNLAAGQRVRFTLIKISGFQMANVKSKTNSRKLRKTKNKQMFQ